MFFFLHYLHCDKSYPLFLAREKHTLSQISIIRCVFNLRYLNIANRLTIVHYCGFVYEYYVRDLKNLFSKWSSNWPPKVSYQCFSLGRKYPGFQWSRIKFWQLELISPAVVHGVPYYFQYKYSSFLFTTISSAPKYAEVTVWYSRESLTSHRDTSSMHRPWFPTNGWRILLLNAIRWNPSILRRNIVLHLLLLSPKEQRAEIGQIL